MFLILQSLGKHLTAIYKQKLEIYMYFTLYMLFLLKVYIYKLSLTLHLFLDECFYVDLEASFIMDDVEIICPKNTQMIDQQNM